MPGTSVTRSRCSSSAETISYTTIEPFAWSPVKSAALASARKVRGPTWKDAMAVMAAVVTDCHSTRAPPVYL